MLRNIDDRIDIVSTFREEEYRFSPQRPYRLFRTRYDQPRNVCLHYHEALEVLVNERVSGVTTVAGIPHDLDRTPAIVVPPGIPHGHHMDTSEGYVLCLQLSLADLAAYLDVGELLRLGGQTSLDDVPFASPQYGALVNILHSLERVDGASVFDRIGVLTRLLKVLTLETGSRPGGGTGDRSLNAAIAWTEAHFAEKVTLARVAEHCGMSRYHFCRQFHRATGTTYSDYLNQVRLDHAKTMLLRHAYGA